MSRRLRKTGNPIHGWLILDKPLGMSSAQAVNKVKYLLKPKKIGHGGTLDPLASGVLPLGLGEATKAFQFIFDHDKTYRFTVRWGEQRNTDDAEGELTDTSDHRPTKEQIEAALPAFVGEVEQVPPAFSAIKVDGERAYARVRAGEDVQMEARNVWIDMLKLIDISDADHATFEMRCGKGTYVRSVARDLGQKLGCLGYVSMLRRVKVGKFDEKRAISLEKLEELVHSAAPESEWLLPIPAALDDIPAVEVSEQAASSLANGQAVSVPNAENAETVQAICEGRLVAIGAAEAGQFKPRKVFLLEE